jgi:hypothetical protein
MRRTIHRYLFFTLQQKQLTNLLHYDYIPVSGTSVVGKEFL